MRYYSTLKILAILIVFVNACRMPESDPNSNRNASIKTRKYYGHPFLENEVIKVNNFFIFDSLLVINNIREDSLFMVYNLNNLKLLYSWGVKGRGPGEFGSFTFILKGKPDRIAVLDFSNMKIKNYKTSDFSETEILDISSLNKPGIREIPQDLDGNTVESFFYLNLSTNKLSIKSVTNYSTPKIIRDFDEYTNIYESPFSIFGCLAISDIQDKLVYAYNYLPKFEIIDENGNKLGSFSKRESEKIKPIEVKTELDIENSIMCYKACRAYGEYFYLLYIGSSGAEVMKSSFNRKVYIEQYNWEGKFISSFELDKFITDFDIVWDNDSIQSIIGINPVDENHLYRFKINPN